MVVSPSYGTAAALAKKSVSESPIYTALRGSTYKTSAIMNSIVHALTVDVEEWFHGLKDEEMRSSAERRLLQGMLPLLGILAEYGVSATFFWLAPVALEYPRLLRELAEAGHEIGCHGFTHEPVYNMTPAKFREETSRALGIIADLLGRPVRTYRAPYFSITRRSLWALDVLAELGITHDCSMRPMRRSRGDGISELDGRPHLLQTSAGPIYEVPISVRRFFGMTIPVNGGAYFRIYPYAFTRMNFIASETERRAVVFYIHPWELDPARPALPYWRDRITNHINISDTATRLRRLLSEFQFSSVKVLLRSLQGRSADCSSSRGCLKLVGPLIQA
jgi:polysaccharide deacetylase family protein (PEP-CTERM system associated)